MYVVLLHVSLWVGWSQRYGALSNTSNNNNCDCQTLQEVHLEQDGQDGSLGLGSHDLNAGDVGQQTVIQDALVSDVQLQSTLNQQVRLIQS